MKNPPSNLSTLILKRLVALAAITLSVSPLLHAQTSPYNGDFHVTGGFDIGTAAGTSPLLPGVGFDYYDATTGTAKLSLSMNRTSSEWLWQHRSLNNAGVSFYEPAMRLDSSHKLLLYSGVYEDEEYITGIALDPVGNQTYFTGGVAFYNSVTTYGSNNLMYYQQATNAASIMTRGLSDTRYGYGRWAMTAGAGVAPVALGNAAVAFNSGTRAEGLYSAAFGEGTKASERGAMAFGIGTLASGRYTSAFGVGTVTQGYSQTSVGHYNIIDGHGDGYHPTQVVFAVGNGSDNEHRSNAFTVRHNGDAAVAGRFMAGTLASATGLDSMALGQDTHASGTAAFAGGLHNFAVGLHSTAFGSQNSASGAESTALGSYNSTSGYGSLVAGVGNSVTGHYGITAGVWNSATGSYALALGEGSLAAGTASVAAGTSTAQGGYSASFGFMTRADSYAQVAVGRYNTVAANPTSWVATDPLFVVGNGNSDTDRKDAFVVKKNGNATLQGTLMVKQGLLVPPQGDLLMGGFTAGTTQARSSRRSAFQSGNVMIVHPCTQRGAFAVRPVLLLALAILSMVPVALSAIYPQWWQQRGVIDPAKPASDYAALNQGQLKNMMLQAYREFDVSVPGGAGSAILATITPWTQLNAQGVRVPKVTAVTSDFAVVNLGQLKVAAQPFYDRLIAIGAVRHYPWVGEFGQTVAPANDFAIANLGQLKNLFKFEFEPDRPDKEIGGGDSDGDGISDWDEVFEDGTDPDDPDSDDDGVSDGEEKDDGTDPNDDDSDDDGTVDGGDQYPNDSRRSEDIPLKFYGAIDLNQYLTNPPFSPSHITISDANRVGWAGVVDTGRLDQRGGSISALRCVTWYDGTVESDVSIPLTIENTTSPAPGSPAAPHIRSYSLRIVGISTSAGGLVVAGNFGASDVWRTRDPTSGQIFWGGSNASVSGIFNTSGSGINFTENSTTDSYEYESFSRNAHSFIIHHRHEPFGGSAVGYTETLLDGIKLPQGGHSGAISDDGHAVVSGESHYYLALPGGATDATLPLTWENSEVSGVNDQKWVVGRLLGEQAYDEIRGSLGFLWRPTPEGKQTFHDLLPEKFREQLKSAVPFAITNVDPATNQPTITFAAEVVKGVGEGTWTPAVFQWEKRADGEITVSEMQTPTGETPLLFAQNTKSDHVGKGKPLNGNDPGAPALIPEVVFAPVDVDKGFDPSMEGDFDPARQGDGYDEQRVPREHWTSVSRKAGGKFIQNKNINLVFDTAAAAKACRVVVRGGNAAPITVQPEFPQDRVTLLTIDGKPATQSVVQNAVVEVWDRAKKSLINVLQVKVLPERKIPFRIWYLRDSQPPDDARTVVPAEVRSYFTNVEQKLKDAFHQACIDFEETDPPQEIEINYDGDGNGALQVNNPEGSADHSEYAAMLTSTAFTAKLNIVVAKRLIYYPVANVQGVGRSGVNRVFVFTDPFVPPAEPSNHRYDRIPWVCAHEVGHALGLSTRNLNLDQRDARRAHDSGRFPYLLSGSSLTGSDPRFRSEGMMSQFPKKDMFWIRHEDWEQANTVAGRDPFK